MKTVHFCVVLYQRQNKKGIRIQTVPLTALEQKELVQKSNYR